jgi:RHS repeat-associated protein
VTAYAYDDLNRLRDLSSTRPATGVTVQSYGFTLGPAGNRTKVSEADGTVREYGYDDVYRLISEKVTTGVLTQYEKAFTYDAVGNRRTQATSGAGAVGAPTAPGSLTYGYDTRDRLEMESGTLAGEPVGIVYGYDDNGNLITKSDAATYVWDVENRLIRAETGPAGSTTITTYAYDADGNRLQIRVTPPTGPPTVINDLVDTSGRLSHVVAETDESGLLKAFYVRGDDLLAVMRPLVPVPEAVADWRTRFVHADGSGSIRRLTDESAAITDGYTYTAFGELLAHTGTDPQPYAFAGEPYDPNTRFSYNRARWLDPSTGRFLAMDTFAGTDEDPASLHKYLYVGANPLNLVDPTGHVGEGGLAGTTSVMNNAMTIALIHLPRVGAILTTALSILTPVEAVGPAAAFTEFSVVGAAGLAGLELRHLGVFERLLNTLRGMRRLALGDSFEKWFGRYVLKDIAYETGVVIKDGFDLTSRARVKGSAVIDYLIDSVIYEVKLTAAAVKAGQARELALFAARTGRVLTYVFGYRPSVEELRVLRQTVGEVAREIGETIPLYVGYVFEK